MKTALRYHSRSGNTKKIAEAIAKELNIPAETTETPLSGPVDILFAGGSLYAGNIDSHLAEFLKKLKPGDVKQIVVFGTAAGPNSAIDRIKDIAAVSGITVNENYFQCRGKFLLANRSHPDENDMQNAAKFAARIAK